MLVKEELCDSAAEVAVDEEAGGGAAASPTGESVSQAPPPGYKWWHGELVKMCPEEIKMLREHLHPDEKKGPKQYKSGWQNRCVLLMALYNKERWNELQRVMDLFSEHHSTSFQVLCLESAIQKWGDKGPKKCGYPW